MSSTMDATLEAPQTPGSCHIDSTASQSVSTHWEQTGCGRVSGALDRVLVLGLERLVHVSPRFWQKEDHLDRLCLVMHTVLERQCLGDETNGFSV